MTYLVAQLISSVVQVAIFTLVPFLFFLFRTDKTVGFFTYIGLYRAPVRSVAIVALVALLFVMVGTTLAITQPPIRMMMLSPKSVTGQLHNMGLNFYSVLTAFLIAWFKTSLSEEILFRGFLARQLMARYGFVAGNLLQAVIFGVLHLLLFWLLTHAPAIPLIFIFSFSTTAGWMIGYLKEKVAGGSILPGWVAHGLGNNISYLVVAFYL